MAITVAIVAPSPVFIGSPYVGSATASGGTAPYTYAVSAGSLPDGLSLNAATGAITGIPLVAGNFDATITATDSLAATGDGDFPVTVEGSLAAPSAAVPYRVSLRWATDECLKSGHQMSRLFFDAIQQPKFSTTLASNQQQPIGLVKRLLFFAEFVQPFVPANPPGPMDTVIIESTLSGQRISLGVPTLSGQGLSRANVFLNGCVPFFANDDSPVEISLNNFGNSPSSSAINLRLFFCNFDIPPFFYATYDNVTD